MLMRSEDSHPFFIMLPNQADRVRKTFGFENAKALDDAVDVLDSWCQQQNHFLVKDFGRVYLETFIITAKGSIEKAKKRLDKRCTLPHLMPEIFTNIKIETEFDPLFKSLHHAIMPMPTKDLYRIIIDKYLGDASHFSLLQLARYFYVCAEYGMIHEMAVGLELILDLTGVTLADVMSKFDIMVAQKMMVLFIEGYGAKIKTVHIINSSKFIDRMVSIIKQGLSEKIANRIQIHTTYGTLTNFMPKESLPSDYGGLGPSIKEAHDLLLKELKAEPFLERMKEVATYGTDELKRISGKFNEEYMGMPGSFRTLRVD